MPTRFKKLYNLQELNFLKNCNLKIGLLGGSFNPAHNGHVQISQQALKLYDLDYVIWLVALQNPFKSSYKSDIFTRARLASIVVTNPKILISTVEYDLKIKYTYQILKYFKERFAGNKFTWIMGADSMAHFRKWEYADLIPLLCNIIIFDRPGFSNLFNFSQFVSYLNCNNIIYCKGIKNNISSTALRKAQNII